MTQTPRISIASVVHDRLVADRYLLPSLEALEEPIQTLVLSNAGNALTTNLAKANEPGNVLLAPGEGDLPRQSVVVVSQIASVEKSRLGERIGSLSPERVDQVIEGLRFQQRAYFGR